MHDLNGDWEIRIQFLLGEAQHRLRVEQEGETLKGVYYSQYSQQPLQGHVQGNALQIQTEIPHEGQRVGYLFKGTIRDDGMQGEVGLGEYWQATWKAQKQ
ncbi:MAG: hypothetical protein O7E52_16395 [Candidatus Poribacteria bacterium]|nr:hypothetical protein [Candidatus Poribacteria bacterium]